MGQVVSEACKQRGKAILERTTPGAVVVEVGVLHGHLAQWCLSQDRGLRWIMVDNWLPADQQPQSYRDTKDDHALHTLEQAQRNRERAHTVAEITGSQVREGSSIEVANGMLDASADLVFIDADHSYEGCAADIAAWHRIVKSGGWLGGHDYRNPDPRFGGVDRAVDEAFPDGVEVGHNFTWWVRL